MKKEATIMHEGIQELYKGHQSEARKGRAQILQKLIRI